jgi:alkaline phosphatase D
VNSTRREFLREFSRIAGCFVATASLAPLAAYSQAKERAPRYLFPQGVASADPLPDGFVLWTRALDSFAAENEIGLTVQVATKETFSEVILQQAVEAAKPQDHTVRVFVQGLAPDRWYYYRFLAPDGGSSMIGRARTAPARDAYRPLNAAVCSCQHYETGYFHAYRQLLLDDARADAAHKLDLVVHLGDFIYDNTDVPVRDQNGKDVALRNADGSARRVGQLPSGGISVGKQGFLARTLDDYRHLYRTYLSDPDLQAARARFPFVCVWDDHEVRNDYWQSFAASGPLQQQKAAGNQAWFEYMPAALTHARSLAGVPNEAKDFVPTAVRNVAAGDFDDDYLSREPNNLLAIGTAGVFRGLQWGELADLILVDDRSYRGPRGFDEKLLVTPYGVAGTPVPPALIATLNAGRTANEGSPPDTIAWGDEMFPNARRDAPLGSMLGAVQKAWFKEVLKNSGATWKIIGIGVPFMRCGFDSTFVPGGVPNGILWTDSWDGYPIERRELMGFINANKIANVVSLAGDRHAHYAGLVYDDYDGPNARALVPELVAAGVSASSRMKIQAEIFADNEQLRALTMFDGTKVDYPYAVAPNLNAWLLFGSEAARTLHDTGNINASLARAKPAINPHLLYADCDAYGYFTIRVSRERFETEFITIREPLEAYDEANPAVRRRVRMTLTPWRGGAEPEFSEVSVEGEPPLLGLRPAI